MLEKCFRFYLSFFGIGLFPIAPGTVASLFTTPIVYYLFKWRSLGLTFFVFATFTTISYFTLFLYERQLQGQEFKDPKWVVQDEVSGMLLGALLLLPFPRLNFSSLALTLFLFVYFRFFDIFKVFPASYFDKSPKVAAIMHDDLIAGIYAAMTTYFTLFILHKVI